MNIKNVHVILNARAQTRVSTGRRELKAEEN